MNWLALRIAAICLAATSVSACDYHGLNSFALPGAPGVSNHTFTISVDLPDANGLVPNAEVKAQDVTVGVIRALDVSGWHAHAQVALNSNVDLPANTVARVGVKSLLGSSYLELDPPTDRPAHGRLAPGALVQVAPQGSYPQTEQVLASASALLNGGGLQQIDTITRELNHALSGRTAATRDVLTQLNTLTGSLNGERTQIVSALDNLNQLSAKLNAQTTTVRTALDTIPPALAVLDSNEHNTVQALTSLDKLSDVGTRVIHNSQHDLLANLHDLQPVLHQLADSGDALPGSLSIIGTGIFPVTTVDSVVRGDYLNVDATLDLTNTTLDRNFLTGTPLAGLLAHSPLSQGLLHLPTSTTNGPPLSRLAPLRHTDRTTHDQRPPLPLPDLLPGLSTNGPQR